MDWTIGHLDYFLGLFFGTIFWDQSFVDRFFWTDNIGGGGEGGKEDHKYLERGGMQSISTQVGGGGKLLLLREGWRTNY